MPVFEGDRRKIVGLLFIKELALMDPGEATPLKTVCQFYQNQTNFVRADTTLDIMFKEFKEGNKGHMAFVYRPDCENDNKMKDENQSYDIIGLVTLEDVIEELIQVLH